MSRARSEAIATASDPADRILAATAEVLDLTLVTAHERLARIGNDPNHGHPLNYTETALCGSAELSSKRGVLGFLADFDDVSLAVADFVRGGSGIGSGQTPRFCQVARVLSLAFRRK